VEGGEVKMNEERNSNLHTHEELEGYDTLVEYLSKLEEHWLYRGQYAGFDLESTFERECRRSSFDLENDADDIEKEIIRHFTRVYDGDDRQKVQDDMLYCLSLMRHYGAPSRLVDFTYSKYVAIYFALEDAYKNVPKNKETGKLDYAAARSCAIWCIHDDGLLHQIIEKYPDVETLTKYRHKKREDNQSFKKLYMENNYNLVSPENPLKLHTRLHLQQGIFLCPGNIKKPFMENLLHPFNKKTDLIRKIICTLEPQDLKRAFDELMRMNITRESLFPGLDGFAQSMNYHFGFYKRLAESRKNWE